MLSHDQRMRYRPNEITVIEKYEIGLFVVVGKVPMAEIAQNFVFTFSQIVNSAPGMSCLMRFDDQNR